MGSLASFDAAISAAHDEAGRDGPLGGNKLQVHMISPDRGARRSARSAGKAAISFCASGAVFGTVVVVALLMSTALAEAARGGRKSLQKPANSGDKFPFVGAQAARPNTQQGGVGMVLANKDGGVVVARVIAGGPAGRAGVMAGDRIVEVDNFKLPKDATSATVAKRVRGKVGTRCGLTVRRKSAAAPVGLSILRGSMSALFPQAASKVIDVRDGRSLIATRSGRTLGVQFRGRATSSSDIRYEWAIAARGEAIGRSPEEQGNGLVAWTGQGATVQVEGWRLELAPNAGADGMIVRKSNLPLALVDAADWRAAQAEKLTYVRPRDAPSPYRTTHSGAACDAKIRVLVDGRPAANKRVTLWLVREPGNGMPSASTTTDDRGETTLPLGEGKYRITGLYSSLNGGESDLYYGATTVGTPPMLECGARGKPVSLELALKSSSKPPHPTATSLPNSATKHPFVGKTLPLLQVRRWFGDTSKLPGRLRGRALLVYVWATWCGPCKRVSPMVSELHARMKDRGLTVVSASVDRDGARLADFAEGQLPGAAPLAWLGPTAMNQLKVSGIPTLIAVDANGIVRVVHTGTGVGLKAWESLLTQMIAKSKSR